MNSIEMINAEDLVCEIKKYQAIWDNNINDTTKWRGKRHGEM